MGKQIIFKLIKGKENLDSLIIGEAVILNIEGKTSFAVYDGFEMVMNIDDRFIIRNNRGGINVLKCGRGKIGVYGGEICLPLSEVKYESAETIVEKYHRLNEMLSEAGI